MAQCALLLVVSIAAQRSYAKQFDLIKKVQEKEKESPSLAIDLLAKEVDSVSETFPKDNTYLFRLIISYAKMCEKYFFENACFERFHPKYEKLDFKLVTADSQSQVELATLFYLNGFIEDYNYLMRRTIEPLVKAKKFSEALGALSYVLNELYVLPIGSEYVRLLANYEVIFKMTKSLNQDRALAQKFKAQIYFSQKKYSKAQHYLDSQKILLSKESNKHRIEREFSEQLNKFTWLTKHSKHNEAKAVLKKMKLISLQSMSEGHMASLALADYRQALYGRNQESIEIKIKSLDKQLKKDKSEESREWSYLRLLISLQKNELKSAEINLNKLDKHYNASTDTREFKLMAAYVGVFLEVERSSKDSLKQMQRLLRLEQKMPSDSLYLRDFQNIDWINKKFFQKINK